MKRPLSVLVFSATILTLAVAAQSQEVFDLLRKGDVVGIKALVEKSPRVLEARDGDGESHAYWVRAEVIEKARRKR